MTIAIDAEIIELFRIQWWHSQCKFLSSGNYFANNIFLCLTSLHNVDLCQLCSFLKLF